MFPLTSNTLSQVYCQSVPLLGIVLVDLVAKRLVLALILIVLLNQVLF
jgi:hypothetical protein